MTDKELIQALRHCGKFEDMEDYSCVGCPAEGKGCAGAFLLAADRLEALLAENEHLREVTKMVPQWVSVEERLPEEYRDEYGGLKCFLVCAENCSQPFRAVYDGKNWGDGWNVMDVTHWQPLPEPPRTEVE